MCVLEFSGLENLPVGRLDWQIIQRTINLLCCVSNKFVKLIRVIKVSRLIELNLFSGVFILQFLCGRNCGCTGRTPVAVHGGETD